MLSGVVDVALDKETKDVGDGVNTSVDCDAELARGKEVSSKAGAIMSKNDGTGDASPGSTNTDRAELRGVVRVFVEGKEVVSTEERSGRFGDGTGVDE